MATVVAAAVAVAAAAAAAEVAAEVAAGIAVVAADTVEVDRMAPEQADLAAGKVTEAAGQRDSE